MGTLIGTSILKGEDGYVVGKNATEYALQKLKGAQPRLSIVFCSSMYNYSDVVKAVREVTNNAPLIGCSTAGEFTEERTDQKSIAVALITSDNYKFYTAAGTGYCV